MATKQRKSLNSSAVDFSLYVIKQASLRNLSILETLQLVIDELDIDEKDVKNLLSEGLKQKLMVEGYELGYLKKQHKGYSLEEFFQ